MDKKKAFTIVELIVAMGLLVMLVGLSSAVFSLSVRAYRTASATIDISRNLRVVTEQLTADLNGLRTDAPLMIGFNRIGVDENGDTVTDYVARFDTIHFFADGDFQTTRQYAVRWDNDDNGYELNDPTRNEILSGNVARIYYGHANSQDLLNDAAAVADYPTYRVLSRKEHILTAHGGAVFDYGDIPLVTDYSATPPVIDYSLFETAFGLTTHQAGDVPKTYTDENGWEFNTITLTNWINALNFLDGGSPDNAGVFIGQCMNRRPYIDRADFQTLHLLMAQGVMDFSIQWAYTNDDLVNVNGIAPTPPLFEGVRWWPSDDPDGNPATNDSDFAGMNAGNPFGVYLTLPNGTTNPNWYTIGNCGTAGVAFSPAFYPKALKFTFRLKDANNLFPDGKTFTHIVTLDN